MPDADGAVDSTLPVDSVEAPAAPRKGVVGTPAAAASSLGTTTSARRGLVEADLMGLRADLADPHDAAPPKPRWSRRATAAVVVALMALAGLLIALPSLVNRDATPSGDSALPTSSGAPSTPVSGAASAAGTLAPSAAQTATASSPVVVGGPDVTATARFLAANTNPGTRLLVPLELVGPLSVALPGRALVTDAGASAEIPDLVVSRGPVPVGIITAPVARFGSLRVGQVMPTALAATDELAARRSAGAQLVSNQALRVSDQARVALRSGAVDPRLLLVLAGLLIDHDVSVDVLSPDASSDPDSARRALKVVDVDGGSATDVVTAFVNAQSRSLLPQSVETIDGGSSVVLHYAIPSPLGLLAGSGFATASP